MSVEPPPSGRPTGPPSGPLSGTPRPGPPAGPPSGSGERGHDDTIAVGPGADAPPPPAPPPGGGGSGPGGGGSSGEGPGKGGPGGGGEFPPDRGGPGRGERPERPWWHSAPRIALITGAIVAAVALIIVFTRPGGSSGEKSAGSEVHLQAADADGPDPFTPSTARYASPPPSPPSLPSASAPASANVTRGVDGAAPGLYAGTRATASCDVEQQIAALGGAPAANKAFASVAGIAADAVAGHLRALTSVQLRVDTRVTGHGYRDGSPTAYQAVLQAGTAVLVDDRGVPRVRCACGNPLTPPVAQEGTPRPTGDAWAAYRASNVVVVAPAAHRLGGFVLADPGSGGWFTRPVGGTGASDRKTAPPGAATPAPHPATTAPPSPSGAY
ncbi:DUF6777 domain-containing protein [Streptomyces sp. NPDC059070]|uniref:DUF6777 domain-containing protein n=1 Tax=Streptomyces sp. NPDC059070 TaxID=3346713 RepID=UPI0036CA9F08